MEKSTRDQQNGRRARPWPWTAGRRGLWLSPPASYGCRGPAMLATATPIRGGELHQHDRGGSVGGGLCPLQLQCREASAPVYTPL